MLRAAIVALLVLLAACSGDAGDTFSSGDRSAASSPGADVAGEDARAETEDDDRTGGTDDTGGTGGGGTGGSVTTSTTTTTPASTTTTRGPTTTAAPRTTTTAAPAAPPPPPPTTTTTAPPPPPPSTTTTTAPPPSGPKHGTRNTGCEQYMYSHINGARADAGQPALTFDGGIQSIALNWSDELARSQTLRHNPDYGSQVFAARPQAQTAAENVGRGYSNESLFNAFMASPGHRRNIESPSFSHVTIGCVNDSTGQIWVTQNFWGS